MDKETQALIDSLTDEQVKAIRKMMQSVIPIFKVFALALMGVLTDDQKKMLLDIHKKVEEETRDGSEDADVQEQS